MKIIGLFSSEAEHRELTRKQLVQTLEDIGIEAYTCEPLPDLDNWAPERYALRTLRLLLSGLQDFGRDLSRDQWYVERRRVDLLMIKWS